MDEKRAREAAEKALNDEQAVIWKKDKELVVLATGAGVKKRKNLTADDIYSSTLAWL